MQTWRPCCGPTHAAVAFTLATALACTGSASGQETPQPVSSQTATSATSTESSEGPAHVLGTWWQPQLV